MMISVFPLNSFLNIFVKCPARIDDVDEGEQINAGYYSHKGEEKQEKKTFLKHKLKKPGRRKFHDTNFITAGCQCETT